eukprot:m.152418 g.152418  ORF g.152418 m.152418 type:complete len:429 (+) comp10162_c0_seq1:52-1338(+)
MRLHRLCSAALTAPLRPVLTHSARTALRHFSVALARPKMPVIAPLSNWQRCWLSGTSSTSTQQKSSTTDNSRNSSGAAAPSSIELGVSQELVQHLAELGKSQHLGVLHDLGARQLADLRFLSPPDLERRGLSPVTARRILDGQAYSPPLNVNSFNLPRDALLYAGKTGLDRFERADGINFVAASLGGFLLSFGCMFYTSIGAGLAPLATTLPAVATLVPAIVFPVGLAMITITGADLLTSNFFYGATPFLTHPQHHPKLSSMMRLFAVSFSGNLFGSLLMAAAASSILFQSESVMAFAAALAVKKTSLPLMHAFVKAIGANWLVNVAVFMSLTARSTGAKMAALWVPITTFVALGLEHSIANMFLIPTGILCGADVSWSTFVFSNLVPVVFGNAVGAMVFVAGLPWYMYWMPNRKLVAENFRRALGRQ